MNPLVNHMQQAFELEDLKAEQMELKEALDKDSEMSKELKAERSKEILDKLKEVESAIKKRSEIEGLIKTANDLFNEYADANGKTFSKPTYKIEGFQKLYEVIFKAKQEHIKEFFTLVGFKASMPEVREDCSLCARDYVAEFHRRLLACVSADKARFKEREQRSQELQRLKS